MRCPDCGCKMQPLNDPAGGPDRPYCPACGTEWTSEEVLRRAAEIREAAKPRKRVSPFRLLYERVLRDQEKR